VAGLHADPRRAVGRVFMHPGVAITVGELAASDNHRSPVARASIRNRSIATPIVIHKFLSARVLRC
jgi:hypothetical protein